MGTRRRHGERWWLWAIAAGAAVLVAIAAPTSALPPPPDGFSHGAAGTARNGFGGSIAPSPTMSSWPGTGAAANGGPFSFVGAHYGPLWGVPAAPNNSTGVGYCVMEDVDGEGTVVAQPDPAAWDAGEMARAGAVMATFGGDRVVPYGIDATGTYDAATGEWQHPSLFGGGEYTRRRQVAVNLGVRMFLEDQSPTGVAAGRKLARDTAVVDGSGGEFSALRNGYQVAQYLADTADVQHAVGGLALRIVWATPDGSAPAAPGAYPVEVHATDGTGHHVGFVPIVQLSSVGIGDDRSVHTVARADNSHDTPADLARWNASTSAGWPVWQMTGLLTTDPRFEIRTNPDAADVADRDGVARFTVEITDPTWELAFHAQAPTDDVTLYSGTGVQGQVTWNPTPQSASIHQGHAPPPPPTPPPTGSFIVRKVLDDAGIQGERDMSGFTFEVVTSDGAIAPTPLGTFTTDAAGRTPAIHASAGTYRISETGRPAWADTTIDTGPITVTFDAGASGSVVEFPYVNRVRIEPIGTTPPSSTTPTGTTPVESTPPATTPPTPTSPTPTSPTTTPIAATTTTSTTSTTTSTTTTTIAPSTTTTTVIHPPPTGTLPRTGGGHGAGRFVDAGSWLFLLGSLLLAVTARRPSRADASGPASPFRAS